MPREPIVLIENQVALISGDPWRYVFSAEGDEDITLDGDFTVEDLMQIIAKKVGNTESVIELCKQFDMKKDTKI